jgi:predicted ribosome quality control (RQC) complex YloA/Tae2 family protein
VGRNKEENKKLLQLATPGDFCLQAADFPGPIGLLRGEEDEETLIIAASITGRYSDAPSRQIKIEYHQLSEGEKRCLLVSPFPDEDIEKLRI